MFASILSCNCHEGQKHSCTMSAVAHHGAQLYIQRLYNHTVTATSVKVDVDNSQMCKMIDRVPKE